MCSNAPGKGVYGAAAGFRRLFPKPFHRPATQLSHPVLDKAVIEQFQVITGGVAVEAVVLVFDQGVYVQAPAVFK